MSTLALSILQGSCGGSAENLYGQYCLDESTRFCREKCKSKTLTSHSYNFVIRVHHINRDFCFCCSVLAPIQKNR